MKRGSQAEGKKNSGCSEFNIGRLQPGRKTKKKTNEKLTSFIDGDEEKLLQG